MDPELKRARGYAKSGITKRVKEIIHLMQHKENEELVQLKMSELKEAFAKFKESHKAYHDRLLTPDLIEESLDYFEMVESQLTQVEENVDLWFAGLEASSWVNKVQVDVQSGDSISQVGSKASSTSSRNSSRLSLAERRVQASATKSILKAETAALQKLQEIEVEELKISQRKAQLLLEVQLAKVKAEEEALYGEPNPAKENEKKTETKPKNESTDWTPLHNSLRKERRKLEDEFETPEQTKSMHAKQIETLIRQHQETISALTLPQPELQVFSGNPTEYHDFIRAFEHLIERKTPSSSARLYYLVQYTTDQVRELVRSCLTMSETTGYSAARKLLAERYGQPYHIATAFVERITSGPPIQNENADALRNFSILLTSCSNTLTEIGYLNRLENPEGLRMIMARLPYSLRQKWREKADAITVKERRDPNLSDITKFVTERARVVDHPIFGKLVPDTKPAQANRPQIPRKAGAKAFATEVLKPQKPFDQQTSSPSKSRIKCPSCGKDHWLSQCSDFRKLKVPERYKFVRDNKLCLNCLTSGHFVQDCRKQSFCRIEGCEKKHSTFLHETEQRFSPNASAREGNKERDQQNPGVKEMGAKPSQNSYIQTNVNFETLSNSNSVVGLPIVPVQVRAKGQSKTIQTYALLDTGSNTSFCTDDILRKLSVKGKKTKLALTTLHCKDQPIECTLVDLEILDLAGEACVDLPSVYTRPSLPVSTNAIGQQRDIEKWPELNGVKIESIEAQIGLLIGNDCPTALQPNAVRQTRDGGPYAVRTVLGWVLNGPLCKEEPNVPTANSIDTDECEANLSHQFEQYCNLEFNDSTYASNLSLSPNDRRALNIMEETIKLKDNHYEIALPWKSYPPTLRSNRILAETRLKMLKRRLASDQGLHQKYTEFMDNLLLKNYAEKIPAEELDVNDKCYYLPHHPILPTTAKPKVRVVYDCQAKHRGTSLNDKLLQGPDLTNSLVGVLTRFRKEPIALIADIESMFYQVKVRPSDCDYLRYLWWPEGNTDAEPEEYRMLVHLFGSVSSPSCANYALKRTAEDNKQDYEPSVIKAVDKSFYVDDCLHSVATTAEGVKIASDLRELLAKGGFRLTKFISNSKELLSSLPESERATSVKNLDFDNTHLTERALGVHWNVNDDTFSYKIVPKVKPANRRGLLSIISSVYDPLGFVSPCILPAKALLQDLCRRRLGWDDEIPESDQVKWKAWLSDLPKLEQFSIPRPFKLSDNQTVQRYELHHFSDASTIGYGAISYLRQVDTDGKAQCSLIMAKSRLAPLKTMTIPRMELSAAVLATRLDQMISKEIDLPLAESTFWTDSTCVIRYIENQDKRFQVFVANRVAAIHEQSEPTQWRYVDTSQNPADDASRGTSIDELLKNDRWIKGPAFLWKSEDTWPERPAGIGDVTLDDPEVKKESVVYASETSDVNTVDKMSFERFSSWARLKRVMAWILRYKRKVQQHVQRHKENKATHYSSNSNSIEPLSLTELKDAEIEILKHVQKQSFKDELTTLRRNANAKQDTSTPQAMKQTSNLYNLDPVLKDGLLLVGGRLQRASIKDTAKHPIIIPKKHHIVNLIIDYYHRLSGHSGVEHTLSLIRQKFWIVGARASVRNKVHSCVNCRRRQAPVMQQKMANLPEDRVTASRPPFTCVGVDCFGPFEVRRGRVNVKRYGVIFTCLALRAVHIEIAYSLDTCSFINALRRFIARRGLPQEMRSDNGGNFVCGEKELRKAVADWNQSQIHDYLTQRGIKWIFNPPAGSHHGGVWERCIRTVRKVLRALVQEQQLDDESLATLMCEVESIVNSRPITKLSDDPRDAEPLTPNHLLLLRTGPNVPPGVFDEYDIYSRKRWRQVQYLANVFWRRWTREYLPSLQERQKWIKQQGNVSVNDVVLMKDDNAPRSSWPLARILEVRTSSDDGLVRSVKLKTSTGELVRPVDKIVMLESATTTAEK